MSDTFRPGMRVRSIDPIDDPNLLGTVVKTPVDYHVTRGPYPTWVVHVHWDTFDEGESAPWNTAGLELVA